tara:strand:+ start:932 stop:1138 length:207 start_codon:yes stop_codon:yes gene_type:complete
MAKKRKAARASSSSACGQHHKLFAILMFILALLWVGESFSPQWWALGWPYFPLIVLILSIGGLEKLHR